LACSSYSSSVALSRARSCSECSTACATGSCDDPRDPLVLTRRRRNCAPLRGVTRRIGAIDPRPRE
jgi:hypothetical protein